MEAPTGLDAISELLRDLNVDASLKHDETQSPATGVVSK